MLSLKHKATHKRQSNKIYISLRVYIISTAVLAPSSSKFISVPSFTFQCLRKIQTETIAPHLSCIFHEYIAILSVLIWKQGIRCIEHFRQCIASIYQGKIFGSFQTICVAKGNMLSSKIMLFLRSSNLLALTKFNKYL